MALEKPYKDIPGTIIFDSDMARIGYYLNQFCMSLKNDDNRQAFLADQKAYLDQWPLTPEQKQAVLTLDLNECMRLGGNIYFLATIGMAQGLTYEQMSCSMTGMQAADYRKMMLSGGRSPEGNRYQHEWDSKDK